MTLTSLCTPVNKCKFTFLSLLGAQIFQRPENTLRSYRASTLWRTPPFGGYQSSLETLEVDIVADPGPFVNHIGSQDSGEYQEPCAQGQLDFI